MWRLVSTWDRDDGSVSRMSTWSRHGRPPRAVTRPIRREPHHPPVGVDLGARAAVALSPVVVSHAITQRPQPQGDSVVWCSQARTIDQDADDGDPGWCTDLWVYLDQRARTIAVSLEGHGLAEHVTGRSHWNVPIVVDLAEDLDDALSMIASRLDALCGDVLVHE